MRTLWIVLLAALLLGGCDRKRSPLPGPTSTKQRKTPTKQAPAKTQPPIRNNSSVGEEKQGLRAHVRVLVSNVAAGEPVHVAFGFDTGDAKSAIASEQVDWNKAVEGLTFTIKTPQGTSHTLQPAPSTGKPITWTVGSLIQDLAIDGSGLGSRAWQRPEASLLTKPGKYGLTIGGELQTLSSTIEVAAKEVQFEVKAAGSQKSLSEIEDLGAAHVAKKNGLSAPPKPAVPTVDDVKDNRWLRFVLREGRGYDVQVVEVLLDRAGKVLFVDDYTHFTCVAQGTRVATPSGDVPIESLHVGDRVQSFDVETGLPSTTRVRSIQAAHSEELLAFGALQVTANHPLYADGRWRLAGDIEKGAELLSRTGPVLAEPRSVSRATVVFDLSVGPPHTYFAGGVLVHNKAVHVPIGPRDAAFGGWFFRRAAQPSASK